MTDITESSAYVEKQAKAYSLYVMNSRAIPAATDGLKAGGRRVLWTARDGHKWKSASLAGATMPIHPHASPEGAIDTLAAQYGNNIPLFTGYSAFGTLLSPTAYSASRYTTVSASLFTKDVVYKDIEIVPMVENYDGTLEEPLHFLPLIPIALLNPSEGIAVGFATNILPRSLDDIILGQLMHLSGSNQISNPLPKFKPIDSCAHTCENTERGIAYYFDGEYTQKDTSTLIITKLPYGQLHDKVIEKICNLIESGTVIDYDNASKDIINITVKFKRGFLKETPSSEILKILGLSIRHIEHLNVLDFSGQAVWNTSPIELIQKFTDWRLTWYVNRYERLKNILLLDLQRYYDIRTAIDNNISSLVRKVLSRSELKEVLAEFKITNLDYIADLPIYRFTDEERSKNEAKIAESEKTLKWYNQLLSSPDERRKIYVSELTEILTKYTKGYYNE